MRQENCEVHPFVEKSIPAERQNFFKTQVGPVVLSQPYGCFHTDSNERLKAFPRLLCGSDPVVFTTAAAALYLHRLR